MLPQCRRLLAGLSAGRAAKGGYRQEVMALGYSTLMAPLVLYLLEIYTSIIGATMLNYRHWTTTVSYQTQRCEFDRALDWNTQNLHLMLVFDISLPADLRAAISLFYVSFSLAVR